ncbi:MAG: glycerophosphodiester phosphodiesterase family protein [Phycisphaerae bacterium]|nr:glycerophosphodiester phosphodiesterase family protein [Phycisphaerae bacterium]
MRCETGIRLMGALGMALLAAVVIGCGRHPSGVGDSGFALIIQAHRGAGNLAPENTLPTFELAWGIGTVPEADIRVTRDGVPVAFHDTHFGRLVKGASPVLQKKGVADLTWQELSALDVGAWRGDEFVGQRVPRMADVFAAMRGRPSRSLYMDIKKVPLDQLVALAREYGVEGQLIQASTKYDEVRAWKSLSPTSRTLLWMGGTEASLGKRLEELRAVDFAYVDQLQIHVKVGDLKAEDPFVPSSAFLQSVGQELAARKILFQTLPSGSSDPMAFHRLMDLGVNSFATDDPKIAVEAVKAYLRARGRE